MAEAGKGSFSLANGVSRDPLHLCVNGGSSPANFDRRIQIKEKNGGDKEMVDDGAGEEGIELSLGLSLNGKFGVDPNRAQKLKRSSSISNFALEDNGARAFSPYAPLTRTCSLPAEAEAETEEWRKRKEAQSQKRMEAKRKRMEKLKNVRVVREKLDKEDPHSEENGSSNGNGLVPVLSNGNALPSSQGSSVSQGSGSSGISDFESQPLQVCGKNVEARSPSSVHSREHEQRPAIVVVAEPAVNNSANSYATAAKDSKEMLRNAMLNMPCVTTKAEGPNGKKVEGFLYRYRKGEEVRIVCVCHGSFLSPAEFVKHAGGGDVAHPLKHIIVTPSCLF